MAEREITMVVNGEERTGRAEPRMLLADFLRDVLGLTGTHLGCEHGVCGACTVLVDGRSARSCLMFAVQAQGREVTTVEGVAEDAALHPVQEALSRHHGLQCGFCTPGFVITALELLEEREGAGASEEDIRARLGGNLCRCTGYHNIVTAVAELLGREEAEERA